MKLRLLVTFLAVGLSIGAVVDGHLHSYGPFPKIWEAPPDPVQPYVVSLEFTSGGVLYGGNGFLVEPGGLLLTNYHVAETAETGLAWVAGDWCLADRIPDALWFEEDLALMRITCDRPVAVALPSYAVALHEREFVVMQSRGMLRRADGSPAVALTALTAGIVLGVHEQMKAAVRGRHDIDTPLVPGHDTKLDFTVVYLLGSSREDDYLGMSGSPVMNLEGDVVGVFSKIHGRTGFIVPMGKAKRRIALWHLGRQRAAD